MPWRVVVEGHLHRPRGFAAWDGNTRGVQHGCSDDSADMSDTAGRKRKPEEEPLQAKRPNKGTSLSADPMEADWSAAAVVLHEADGAGCRVEVAPGIARHLKAHQVGCPCAMRCHHHYIGLSAAGLGWRGPVPSDRRACCCVLFDHIPCGSLSALAPVHLGALQGRGNPLHVSQLPPVGGQGGFRSRRAWLHRRTLNGSRQNALDDRIPAHRADQRGACACCTEQRTGACSGAARRGQTFRTRLQSFARCMLHVERCFAHTFAE